jgi:periplasmic divalent cation tolerance protein
MAKKAQQLLVMTSCRGSITAKKIANEVISQNLGSSVHIINGVNTFTRWVGKVENSEEQLLLITNSGSCQALEKCINRLHPHELPEIITVPISSGLTDIVAN